MTKDEALKLALEALKDPAILNGVNNAKFFIKQALAQPEQEPVAWEVGVVNGVVTRRLASTVEQPQRTWVGLTDEKIDKKGGA